MFISSSVTSFPYTECKHGGLLSWLRLSCKRNEACTATCFVSVRGPWKVMRHGRSILFSFDMPTIFCVPGCHQKEARSRGELFVLQFPCSPLWRKQWIRGVRWDEGNDLEIAEGTKVCLLHFRGGDHFVQLNPTEWSSYLYQIYDFPLKILFQEFKTQCKLWLKNILSLSKPQTQILTCFAQNPAQKSLSSCHNCRSQILVPWVSNLRRGRQTRDPCARWLALWIGVCQMCKDLNPR